MLLNQTVGRNGWELFMHRAQPEIDEMAVQSILHAALKRFHRNGYDRTTLRSVAADAHVSPKLLQRHFASKQALLAEIIEATHQGALAVTRAAVAEASDDPADRLEAAVWAQCDYQARHPLACLIAGRELLNLDEPARERATATLRRQRQIFADILVEGVERGDFDIDEPALVSRALFDLCSAIPISLELSETQPPRKLARVYCDLAVRMAGVGSPR
jgi:AcrR family transcriptional regulator